MKEETIRQLVLEFAGDETLGHLEKVAQYKMGFEQGVHVNLNGGKYLHEWMHAISAILRGEDLQKPNIPKELCAYLINLALVHPLTDSDFFISIKKDLTNFLKRLRGVELNSLIKVVLENTPRNSLEAFVLQYNQNLFKIADLSGDKTLQILTLQVLASLDFDPEVIGRCFDEKVRQEVIEINKKYQFKNLIKDEEINEHIKLALIIRGRILSSQQKEWAEMDLETEQSNLTISSILPDITVSELEKIPPQFLLDYARDGVGIAIKKAVDSGLDQKVVETMAQKIDEVAYALYKKGKPNGEIENPRIQEKQKAI
jgi:hypothetical protein